MASNLRVDQIIASTTGSVSIGTATFTGGLSGDITGLNVTGVITATTLNQNVTGVVTATGGFVVGTGATISGSTNTITASTNGSERVRIDSSGNVGIGTESPSRPLTVAAASGASVNILGVFDTRYANSGTVGNSVIAFSDPTSTAGQFSTRLGSIGDNLAFYTNGANERLRITSTGNVQIANGNLVFSTSGTGIDFSATGDATGMTSELLDDYEEGTWTPGLDYGSPTFYSQVGSYVKIGRLVMASFSIHVNLIGGASSYQMTGLPYACNSLQPAISHVGSVASFSSLAVSVGSIYLSVDPGGTRIRLIQQTGDVSSITSATTNFFGNNSSMHGAVIYQTN